MKLYDHPASPNCLKTRIALRQLEIPVERVTVDLFKRETRTPEHMARNPDGRVPVLELDSGETIPESGAILLYLAEGTDLLPEGREERAHVHQWLFFEQNQIEPAIATARVMKWRNRDRERPDAYAHRVDWGNEALDSLDAHLTDKDFLVPGRYTVADMAVYAYTHVAHDVVDMAGRDAVAAWIARVESQPGFVNDLAPLP